MAFRDDEHFRQVQESYEYNKHLDRWVANAERLPGETRADIRREALQKGSEFNRLFGAAFFGEGRRRGEPIKPFSTDVSREAFLNLLWEEGVIEVPTEESFDDRFFEIS